MKDMYGYTLVCCKSKQKRNEVIALVHMNAKALGIRVRTQKISPTRFYCSKQIQT